MSEQLDKLRQMAKANEGRIWKRIADAQAAGFADDPPSAEEIDRHRKLLVSLESMETFERLREMTREAQET